MVAHVLARSLVFAYRVGWMLAERCAMGARSKVKITKTLVDHLSPGNRHSDSEVIGFQVRCQTHSKTYSFVYRRGGVLRQVTIGTHGSPWTPDAARNEAKRLAGLVAAGEDPAGDKAAKKGAATFAEVSERFLAEHAEAKRKASTATEYRRLIEKFVLPAIGGFKIGDVKRSDVSRVHGSLKATPYQANRVLAVMSAIFSFAEREGLRPDRSNPCYHVERFKEERRDPALKPDKLACIGKALAAAEERAKQAAVIDGEIQTVKAWQDDRPGKANRLKELRAQRGALGAVVTPYALAAIRLLSLTGARMNEILTLRWSEVSDDMSVAHLPDSKTGKKTLRFSAPARSILEELPRVEGNPYVIVGRKAGAHLVNLHDAWEVVRDAAGVAEMRIHDLRHAFVTTAIVSGVSVAIAGKAVGHSQMQTTAGYAHPYEKAVCEAVDVTAKAIQGMMGGAPQFSSP